MLLRGSSYANGGVNGRRAGSFGGSQEATTQRAQFGVSGRDHLGLLNGVQ